MAVSYTHLDVYKRQSRGHDFPVMRKIHGKVITLRNGFGGLQSTARVPYPKVALEIEMHHLAAVRGDRDYVSIRGRCSGTPRFLEGEGVQKD